MKRIFNEMRKKTTELLNPHQSGHPITNNQSFAETLESLRRQRRQEEPARIVAEVFDCDSLHTKQLLNGRYDLQALTDALSQSTELDVERSAASDALDCLNACYKISPQLSLSPLPFFLSC
jgi:hypothetical protein